jgi:hypothetical protein
MRSIVESTPARTNTSNDVGSKLRHGEDARARRALRCEETTMFLRSVRALAVHAAAVLLLAACSRGELPPRSHSPVVAHESAIANEAFLVMQEVMEWLVDPAAGVVFAAAGRTSLPERRPSDPMAWQAVADAAQQLAEQGRLLAQPALTSTRADWLGLAAEMQRSANAAMEAARHHDADATAQASDALRAACQGCHLRYAPALAQRPGDTRNP